MTDRGNEPVANPDRTQVDADTGPDDAIREDRPDRRDRREGDPHDQPWRDVAREVREAVENADGPVR